MRQAMHNKRDQASPPPTQTRLTGSSNAPAFQDRRAESVWQGKLQNLVSSSPALVAQRALIAQIDSGRHATLQLADFGSDAPLSESEELALIKNASPEQLHDISAQPEVAAELAKLQSEQKAGATGGAQDPVSAADDANEHEPTDIPSPAEEAAAHGVSLEQARKQGIVQRRGISTNGAPVQMIRPLRAAAAAARYLIATMSVAAGTHGFTPIRRNHQYPVSEFGGVDYQYTTNAQGCIDFVNNEAPNHDNPRIATHNIQGYFTAHNWDLRNATRYYHFKAANAKQQGLADNSNVMPANGGSSPPNQTWHHDEQVARMDLLPRDVHAGFAHRGGFSIWGS